ncbi:zinc finger and BTB domain containing 20 (predicted), isoform CRA_a [Rattus norvegicus]|uniref:Zinc finger and BTB domain containing 20 (Predicted), isoform CRA_a n=1 Tax=Rattus norvegicus TaxID=10116 RepID=A6IR25_RAT|nr:zinc finger and BTB domain containing 20 (predicted), isoform CRA_a [Rattus norvegicus]
MFNVFIHSGRASENHKITLLAISRTKIKDTGCTNDNCVKCDKPQEELGGPGGFAYCEHDNQHSVCPSHDWACHVTQLLFFFFPRMKDVDTQMKKTTVAISSNIRNEE